MGSSWETSTIDDIKASAPGALAMGPFGSDIKTDNFVPEGVPVIRGGNLSSGRFHDADFVYLTEEKADELRNANAFPGDLVFTHRGTLGQVGIIPWGAKFARYVISQSQMKLTCNTAKVDPLFVFYFFKSAVGQHQLLASTSTTGVPAISRPLTSLKQIRIPLPSPSEQRIIARILGSLDDKIELNCRMNATLEETARAIFQSWFVDFDPVRAKAAGRGPTGLDSATAALFPDGFDVIEGREIPRGWKVVPFDLTIDMMGGGTPKTSIADYWDGDIPWFSVVDAPSDGDVFVIDTEKKITQLGLEESSTRILAPGTTIISARGTVGRCALVGAPMAMNQSCYGVRGKDKRGDYYTYFTLRELVNELKRIVHGGVFDTITRDTFKAIKVPPVSIELTQRFDKAVEPFLQQILSNLYHTRTLAAVRDALLPKLLSGQVRVRDAERFVEEEL